MFRQDDMRFRCDQCGTHTGMDTHCCGRCATDFNERDRAAGIRRINGRRTVNGLPLLVIGEDGNLTTEATR